MAASAKKTVAKKTTTAKKTAPAKSAPKTEPADPLKEVATDFASMLRSGVMDAFLFIVADALDARLEEIEHAAAKEEADAKKKTAPRTSTSQKLPAAPPKKTATLEPEAGAVYLLTAKFPKVGGAKVKFLRYKKGDDTKTVVEIQEDKPGFPKGKQFIAPVAALEVAPTARTRSTAKKTAARKSSK